MSKITNYMMLMTTLLVVLTAAGIQTGASNILIQTGLIDSPQNFTNSSFFTQLIGAIILGTASGIIIGVITRSSPKDVAIGSLLGTFLVYFILDMLNILNYVNGLYMGTAWEWVRWIVLAVFGSLIVGFMMSILDFFQGGS